eukprot:scaffold783_cov197-Alexandrium_tamarense.AAC.3
MVEEGGECVGVAVSTLTVEFGLVRQEWRIDCLDAVIDVVQYERAIDTPHFDDKVMLLIQLSFELRRCVLLGVPFLIRRRYEQHPSMSI